MTITPAPPTLAERLREVVAAVRGELDVSRHVFRAGPSYVVRDPITFATHRFDAEDYRVLSALRSERPLGETFGTLVSDGTLEQGDEEAFYAFVLDLHQRSLLSLPINDAATLYQRYERRQQAQRLSKLLGVFFMRMPLLNPNAFLTKTLPLFGWLFTAPALIAWAVLCAAAGAVALARWEDLASPVQTMLDADNALMLIGALIGLKVVHEFGHAYACRAFGGHVPEMGVFLVLFTPLAYVDATDSWTFTKTHRRAIVTLGGVYFESIVGAIALFVWAATDTSTLNALAYQVVVLSTITTALFNLNPLLRYDAYYLVSDLVGIPNLRARCQESVVALLKRVAYGLRQTPEGEPIRPHPGLAAFGLAQAGYRVVIMTTLATVLVLKFGTLGLAFAAILIGLTIGKLMMAFIRYLAWSPEIAGRRVRAVFTTTVGAALVLGAVAAIPIPWPIEAKGIVTFEQVSTIRAPSAGRISELPLRVGERVRAGDPIAILDNPELRAEFTAVSAEADLSDIRTVHAATQSPGEGALAASTTREVDARRNQLADEVGRLRVGAPRDGRVLDLTTRSTGVALREGDPIAVFAAGDPEAVFHILASDFETLGLVRGDEVACRSPAHPGREIVGTVARLGQVGVRGLESDVARNAPEGLVPLNAATGAAANPYFEIRVRLDPNDAELAGTRLVARLPSRPRTTAQVIDRGVRRFMNKVHEGAGG